MYSVIVVVVVVMIIIVISNSSNDNDEDNDNDNNTNKNTDNDDKDDVLDRCSFDPARKLPAFSSSEGIERKPASLHGRFGML